jgi:glycosyltransferase involved in cell wall biosynthesis
MRVNSLGIEINNTLDFSGKKIVFFFGSLDLGGAERQGLLLARYFRDVCGADIEVMGFGKPGRLADLCHDEGFPVRGVRFPILKRWLFIPAYRTIESVLGLFFALRAARPQVLMPYTLHANIWCGLFWKISGAGTCIWNQRDEGLGFNNGVLDRLALRNAPVFVANSEGGSRFLLRQGVTEEKITVINNGVILGRPHRTRQEWRGLLGVDEDAYLALMTANISSMKDHETLVRAWARVCEKGGPGDRPVLLLAGRLDDRTDRVRELIGELGLGDCIRMLGPVDDIPGLLSGVDLVVHSSVSEGFPNSVLEAMASERLVIANDIPGIRSVMGDENSQFLAPVGDPAAMAEKIIDARTNPDRYKEHIIRNRERVSRLFSYESMGERYAEIISNALQR